MGDDQRVGKGANRGYAGSKPYQTNNPSGSPQPCMVQHRNEGLQQNRKLHLIIFIVYCMLIDYQKRSCEELGSFGNWLGVICIIW